MVYQPPLLECVDHLGWLPDESVYSLASRHHRLSGNARPEQTASQLFGHARGGYPHDLPAGLDYFSHVLGGRLGAAEEIALERTVLPLLVAFRGSNVRANAVAAMRSSRLGALKAQLGLLASGFAAICPLKACASCVAEDAARFGTAYWHVTHQNPGVWLCEIHERWLYVSKAGLAGQGRYTWMNPSPDTLVSVVGPTVGAAASKHARRLAEFVGKAAQASAHGAMSAPNVAKALWAGLLSQGWASPDARLKRSVATARLARQLEALKILPEWNEARTTESVLYAQLHSLIANPGAGHALRVLVLAMALYDSWVEFHSAVCADRSEANGEPSQTRCETLDDAPGRFRTQLAASGSLSASARAFGISVSTAQGWTAADGRQPLKRPSKMRDTTLVKLESSARLGRDVSTIAGETGVSECSVRRALRTTVGLRATWLAARRMERQKEARTAWCAALLSAGSAGVSAARLCEPAVYAWLNRNDRAWLQQVNADARKSPAVYARVDWDRRDEDLARACQQAGLVLRNARPKGAIKLVEILQQVPALRQKLHQLDRLPLTMRAIRSICARGGE